MRLSLSLSRPQYLNTLMAESGSVSLMWFRKGLRIHDNPALEHASKGTNFVYPVFVIDPHYMEPDPNAFSPGSTLAGLNRIRFLLESLVDLDLSLKKLGSRLLVLKGEPSQVLIRCLKQVSFFVFPLFDTQAIFNYCMVLWITITLRPRERNFLLMHQSSMNELPRSLNPKAGQGSRKLSRGCP